MFFVHFFFVNMVRRNGRILRINYFENQPTIKGIKGLKDITLQSVKHTHTQPQKHQTQTEMSTSISNAIPSHPLTPGIYSFFIACDNLFREYSPLCPQQSETHKTSVHFLQLYTL